jgi:hypothetical protein
LKLLATAGTMLVTAMLIAAPANARTTGATASAPAPAVPRFYVALPDADNFANVPGDTKAQVRDTFTGKLLLTLKPFGKDRFVSVSAAADDRTFVIGANPNLSPPAVPMATDWYLVHLVPGSPFHATMRKLRIPAPPSDNLIDATALSPDGRQVALLGIVDRPQRIGGPPASADVLRVYSVATGKLLRTWSTAVSDPFGAYVTLFWTGGGRGLAFGYTFAAGKQADLGVRMLDVRRPGRNLLADSRLAWFVHTFLNVPAKYPFTCAIDYQVLVTPDGRRVVCTAVSVFGTPPKPTGSACPAGPAWQSVGFLEYSTATGRGQRALYKENTNCSLINFGVLWTSATGGMLLGDIAFGSLFPPNGSELVQFGVFSAGHFTRLPVPPTTTTIPNAIAW